jgi:hypothetical protein|tara:strand:+ start:720 stop:1118 length:399 start_codon:yes stop_codon:yes gene_type:complete
MNENKHLKTLKYNTSRNKITSMDDLNIFLNNEMERNKKGKWCKLSKTEKMKKLKKYINKIYNEEINEKELNSQIKLLIKMIDKNKSSKNVDIIYNNEIGEIENITDLSFNILTSSFVISQSKNTTLKNIKKN